ncbi:MAG: fibronectin type III domain-containing protein, partial [Acidobacteria bacterium]|nr:fibronectin type III domain-containing protein [Acidobacteriota bacterium]
MLVSNVGRQTSGFVGRLITHDQAQAFTTGAHAAGYTLTSVELNLAKVSTARSYTVGIYTSSSGAPGSLVGMLTLPSSEVVGNNAYTHTGLDLAANTTYFVVVDSSASFDGDTTLNLTPENSEDSGGASGWSIGDTGYLRAWGSTGPWGQNNPAVSLKIRVNGRAKGNRAPVFDPASYSFTLAENADGSITAVEVGTVSATDADTDDTLTYSIAADDTGGRLAVSSAGKITYAGRGENFEGFENPATAFSLTVRASDGTAQAEATVTVAVTDVTEKPGKPPSPTVSAPPDSTTSLDVTWTAPANTGPPITGYDLRYRKTAGDGWTAGPQDMVGLTATIDSLDPGTQYLVQVRATNDEGDGRWSDPGAESTAPERATSMDGTPGLTVSKSAVSVDEAPGRRKQTYTVVLNTQPPGRVTVIPVVAGPSVAIVRTGSPWRDLTFTPQNWSTPQTVTVKAVDDDFIDPLRQTTIIHRVRGYGSVRRGPEVAVTVTNDDSPGVTVFANTHSLHNPHTMVVRENGTGHYRIKLDKGPIDDVTITLSSADPSTATAEPMKFVRALTFTRDNWDEVQHVLVRGVNDEVINPEVRQFNGRDFRGRRGRTTRIVHGISGGGYDDVPVADAPVFVSDDNDDGHRSPTGVSLPHGEFRIKEGWGTRRFTLSVVLLGGTLATDTIVQGSCSVSAEDTARVPDDLACAPFEFTIPPGVITATTTNFEVTVVDDDESEGDETISVDIAFTDTATGRTFSAAGTLTIVDNEPGATAEVSVADARVTEAEGVTLDFTVTLDRAPGRAVTVDYATADGTARAGEDYTTTSGTLAFGASETVKTISVSVLDDPYDEGEETLTLTLSNASGLRIADGEATGTIVNTDPLPLPGTAQVQSEETPPRFLIYHDPSDHAAAARYEEGVRALDGAGVAHQTRHASRAEAGALAGVANSVMPRFFFGEPAASGWEPRPKVNNGGLRWLKARVAALPGLSAGDDRVGEAAGATLTFTVTLDEAAQGPVTVDYTTADGTATAGEDYTAVSGTLTFSAGEISKTVSVAVLDDTHDEGEETLTLRLSSAAGARIGDGEATGTIANAGPPPGTVQAASGGTAPRFLIYHDPSDPAAAARYEEGVRALGDAGVSHRTRHESSAEAGVLAGVANSVMPRFFLGDPTAPGWGPPQPKVNNGGLRWLKAWLANLPGISAADARVTEAAGARLDFTVALGKAATVPVTVDYATADGTAVAGQDYTAASGTLTFAAGETSKPVSVLVLDDAHDEGEETLTLRLSNAAGARITDGTATGIIANTDPLQQERLAQFGRSVTSQTVAALMERLAIPPGSGSHVTLGGQRLGLLAAPRMDDEASVPGSSPPVPASEPGGRAPGGWDGTERWRGAGFAWDTAPGAPGTAGSRGMSGRELLPASSFRLTPGGGAPDGSGRWTAWGRAGLESFSGRDGEVATGVFGADRERGRWLVGAMATHGVGKGAAEGPALSYDLESTVTAVNPYLRVRLSDRHTAWGLLGYGLGSLDLAAKRAGANAAERYRTDLEMTLGALGGRAELLTPAAHDGFALALRGDAFFSRTWTDAVSVEGVGDLAAAAGEASRMRLALEGSRLVTLEDGSTLPPTLEVGLRQAGGDAEPGPGPRVGRG